MWEIVSNFVAFLENLNFTNIITALKIQLVWCLVKIFKKFRWSNIFLSVVRLYSLQCYRRGFNGLVLSDMHLISSYRISKGGINMHVKIILLFLCFFQVNSCPSGQRRRSRPQNGLTPRQNYQIPPYTQVDYFLPSSLQYTYWMCHNFIYIKFLIWWIYWIYIPHKSLSIMRFRVTQFFSASCVSKEFTLAM